MPSKPKRPCSYQMCPKLTDKRYCMEHEKQENKRYETYQRDPSVRKRYGSAWKKRRARYVLMHPYCELCFQQGKMTQVEHVHHKIPLSKGGTHDDHNLMSLCHSCHARLHAKDGSRWHKG